MNQPMIDYEQDFYAWLMHNARLIREGQFAEVDSEHVAEELESMGRSEKRELVSRLTVLLTHLLKWCYQPDRRSRSWQYTIEEQRQKVCEVLEDSPSLRHEIDTTVSRAYDRALLRACQEPHLDKTTFPALCPYTIDQILDVLFYPEM